MLFVLIDHHVGMTLSFYNCVDRKAVQDDQADRQTTKSTLSSSEFNIQQ